MTTAPAATAGPPALDPRPTPPAPAPPSAPAALPSPVTPAAGWRAAPAALVHDWLPVYGGAERVLEAMLRVLPHGDVFSLLDFVPEGQRAFLGGRTVRTSFIQRLPFARSSYRNYLPFAPLAIEQFDLGGYDVVLSSSYVVAKGVLTTPDQLHVSYVHSPVRYAWDLYFEYLRQGRLERGLKGTLAKAILHYVRLFDAATALRPDLYLANSHTVARRVRKTYRRPAAVLYPPVDTERFRLVTDKDDYYVTMSRLVPYKRVDLIVEAFAKMPTRRLVVVGDGPEMKRIAARATPNVELLGYRPDAEARALVERARAFVFAAEEDFGIVPVEAQACGTPVVAYGRGGATETVVPGVTGRFFETQTPDALVAAVEAFERDRYDPAEVRAHAERFAAPVFERGLAGLLDAAWAAHRRGAPLDAVAEAFTAGGPEGRLAQNYPAARFVSPPCGTILAGSRRAPFCPAASTRS